MSKRITHDEFIKEISNLVGNEYTVISEYVKAKMKVEFIHNICGEKFFMSPDSFKRGKRCPYCSGRMASPRNSLANLFPEISKEWHSSKNHELTPADIVSGSSKKHWWVCEKGHEYQMQVRHRTLRNLGCSYCSGNRVCIDNCLASINPLLAKEWSSKNKISPREVTWGSRIKVWWKCPKCNHEWKTTVVSRSSSGCGCPQCSKSKGEKRIREWLEQFNIMFIPQQKFKDLIGIGGRLLSYDFYIPQINLLIEYQGEFHDGSNGEYTKLNLKKQQEHDKRKREYAKIHNLELLEIWHWDFDNIEEILDQIHKTSKII